MKTCEQEIVDKTTKVINSCKTPTQLKYARRYAKIALHYIDNMYFKRSRNERWAAYMQLKTSVDRSILENLFGNKWI